jgi:Neutral/alkaline non-lysosomal ceramidase, N-terminal
MRNRFLGVVCILLLWGTSIARAELRAGVAKVDITPKTNEPLWGFEDRTDPATGTLDPLYARILVLEAGGKRIAIVTLDLGRTFGEPSLDHLKEVVSKSSGISCLLLSASHTHAGPVIKDEYAGAPPEWEQKALDAIAAAIKTASDNLQVARIGSGTGSVFIGHNRLRVNDDGTVNWFERNPTMVPTSPVDPTVTVVRIDDRNGVPLAILINYACHPVVLGSENSQYSADYPGITNRVVEKALGGSVQSFFVQGADGDINPYYAVTPMKENAVKLRDWTGEQLGQEVVRVAKGIQTVNDPSASIEFREETLHLKLRWDPEQFRAALVKTFGAKSLEQMGARIRPIINARVTSVLVDKQIAIIAVPGEPFVDFQESWRARCPVPTALFFGYSNGYHGYFPTISAASRGGYGAASASTWVEVGAGERMVDWALIQTYQMMGKYSALPDDLTEGAYK